ncbi:MAG: methionyl-tRNA formyltransferase, partial [Candidatus Paceibacterales bacterium]
MKIVFFGTPDFAVPALKLLIESGYNISAVFTGRGPINTLTREQKIKVFQPASLKKDDAVFEEFKNLKPDICIVAAYGKILPQKFLDVPRYGFLNIHPSLLPKYRGPSPIQSAILNGDKETGVAIMVVDAEVDHGPILKDTTYALQPTTYYKEAEKDLAEIGAKLLLESLPEYLDGGITPREQNHGQATFTKMFQREDGKINWNKPCDQIYNQIRALGTEPGTWTTWKGKILNIIKVERGSPSEDPGDAQTAVEHLRGDEGQAPVVVKINNDVAVATKKCYLILKSIQLEGGKEMD